MGSIRELLTAGWGKKECTKSAHETKDPVVDPQALLFRRATHQDECKHYELVHKVDQRDIRSHLKVAIDRKRCKLPLSLGLPALDNKPYIGGTPIRGRKLGAIGPQPTLDVLFSFCGSSPLSCHSLRAQNSATTELTKWADFAAFH